MNKIKTAISILACCAACVSGLHGQGTFGNLDFEATTIPPGTPAGSVSTADAFPGWQAYYGSSLQPVVRYNMPSIAVPNISLVGPGAGFASPLEGSYSALLQSGFDGSDFLSASLAQTGTIPPGALFLQMRVYNPLNDSFQVTVGGNTVAILPIQTTPQYTVYAGDIASLAGLTTELRISALANAVPSASTIYLDSIRFSAVPEPSTWALFALGSFALWMYRRR